MKQRGKLLVLEGPDGGGKSTLANRLVEFLKTQGVDSQFASFPGHEPGTLGRLVHRLHHNAADYDVSSIEPTSLQLLHIAAHIDAIEGRILPALQRGCWVVLDRFWWSTWVYGIRLGANRETLKKMIDLEMGHWGGVRPAIGFLLLAAEPGKEKLSGEEFTELSAAYRELARQQARLHPVLILTGNQPALDVWSDIICALKGMITDSVKSSRGNPPSNSKS